MRVFLSLLTIIIGGFAVFWLLTQPQTLDASQISSDAGDPIAGRIIFFAGGCASCHATLGQDDATHLGGGLGLKTPFGTFNVPNISPSKSDGIGNWSMIEFANALKRGVSPEGSHYYPSFPYTSYQRMTLKDVADLKAFMDTLQPVASNVADHDLPFPFTVRRGLGLWKQLYLDKRSFVADPNASDKINRGAYLVNSLGHCSECHTPRNLIGGPDDSRFLSGGPNPEGEGRIPNITPHPDGIGSWSETDIAYSLESGFTPDFDSFGGSMAAVQKNMAQLSASDREAIAAYLKSIPALANAE